MYRLLLIAPSAEGLDPAFWRAQGFTPAPVCARVDDALLQLSQQSFDAIAAPDSEAYACLQAALRVREDSTPAFILPDEPAQRLATLKDVRHLLHRLHVDFTDEQYTPGQLSKVVQYDMLHNYLAGLSTDAGKLSRWFTMLRSDIPLTLPCRIYLLGLPRGDMYLADRWHHGQQRLQKALERNFFSHIEQIGYCAVAFQDPCSARLLLVPKPQVDLDGETQAIDDAVIRMVNDIKDYLELDIDVYQAGSAACVTDVIDLVTNTKEA